jgi:hypothetical protein
MDLPDKFVHCPRVFSFSTMVKQAPTHIGVQPNCFVCLILSSIFLFAHDTPDIHTQRERENGRDGGRLVAKIQVVVCRQMHFRNCNKSPTQLFPSHSFLRRRILINLFKETWSGHVNHQPQCRCPYYWRGEPAYLYACRCDIDVGAGVAAAGQLLVPG